jgi:very-short-patch-repair endonuclease
MGSNVRTVSAELWELVARQHGVVTRAQLLERGFGPRSIEHRLTTGRLHPVARGVYAVGRPDLPPHGRLMAAVLSCGSQAVVSHGSAAGLWGIRHWPARPIDVTVPPHVKRRRPGTRIHRHDLHPLDRALQGRVPATSVHRTLLDLAATLDRRPLEAAINEADKLDLTDPESLRSDLDRYAGLAGVATLRALLDRRTFALTDSELERRFLPLTRKAGLPLPSTGQRVNGFKVDFYWPDLGLVVETDGLRYHRTPAQQARDRLRDQTHSAAGLTPLRFTHAQVRYEAPYVGATLTAVAERLRRS